MQHYFCNPLNVNYRYQFNKNPMGEGVAIGREAADPSMLLFKGKYYIFASMTLGVWVSDDLAHWENHRLPEDLPLYDYAPDVRMMGEFVYLSACRSSGNNKFYRTKDIVNGPYEEIPATFYFSDPNLFVDEDNRVYFYWGLSSTTPIWGVELDPKTMRPIGDKSELIWGDPFLKGFERVGEDNEKFPCSEEELKKRLDYYLKNYGKAENTPVDPEMYDSIKGFLSDAPYIEGSWMNKHHGRYYLQYAFAGTQYNIYGDGVYVSEHPLGPFTLAKNNPYSYKPGGFLPGAGHGSTMWDKYENLWHAATMRISMNHNFERRAGLWPAGFDGDGELFCNQRYGDWPARVEQDKMDPWRNPDWYLLSYSKPVKASSYEEGKEPEKAADENVRTWWRAGSSTPGEWLEMDLGKPFDVHAIQINFADDKINVSIPSEKYSNEHFRYIEEADHVTRWVLEGSLDQQVYFVIEDKSDAQTDLPHDLVVREEGLQLRFLRLTILEIPYAQKPCISGLRVFGCGKGEPPTVPIFHAARAGEIDIDVTIEDEGAVGYNILWGHSPDKLYHSYMVFGTRKRISALVKGEEYFVRVDAFNENGITEGNMMKL